MDAENQPTPRRYITARATHPCDTVCFYNAPFIASPAAQGRFCLRIRGCSCTSLSVRLATSHCEARADAVSSKPHLSIDRLFRLSQGERNSRYHQDVNKTFSPFGMTGHNRDPRKKHLAGVEKQEPADKRRRTPQDVEHPHSADSTRPGCEIQVAGHYNFERRL